MLRGYRVHLSLQNTSIEEFPTSLLTTLGNVYFLSLSLQNNKIRTISPFKSTVQPWVNHHGTILESIDLSVSSITYGHSLEFINLVYLYIYLLHLLVRFTKKIGGGGGESREMGGITKRK